MALAQINLQHIENVQEYEAGRQLAHYINTALSPLVYSLPTEPYLVEAFIPVAIQSENNQRHLGGRYFSFHIISSFLLGLNWKQDPLFKQISDILDDNGMTIPFRIDLAMYNCIEAKKHLDTMLLGLHNKLIEMMDMPGQMLTAIHIPNNWMEATKLRGVSEHINTDALRLCYENDYRQISNLPLRSPNEENISYGEIWARKNMGLPLIERDPANDLSDEQVYLLLVHLHLALSFGRFYRFNPLHQPLQKILSIAPKRTTEAKEMLADYLRAHQKRLQENS